MELSFNWRTGDTISRALLSKLQQTLFSLCRKIFIYNEIRETFSLIIYNSYIHVEKKLTSKDTREGLVNYFCNSN